MKKILIMLLIVLFCLLAYYCIFKSVSIANFNILSFQEISNKSEELDADITKAKTLTTVNYQSKISELESNAKTLSQEKEKYEDLVKLSTAEEIILATQTEKYEIEYLWTAIGNHATDDGVVIKMEVATNSSGLQGTYDLNFTVNGSYITITDFIYDLENDSSLEFQIDNFSLLPGGSVLNSASTDTTQASSSGLQAKFVVKNLSINMANVEDSLKDGESNKTLQLEQSDTIPQEVETNTVETR